MPDCVQHPAHDHRHAAGCGHTAVRHDGHLDYLHDGHLHNAHAGHVDDHTLIVNAGNPDACTTGHACTAHPAGHRHGASCGHAAVPHGRHVDYLVAGHLHSGHASHCDDHGRLGA